MTSGRKVYKDKFYLKLQIPTNRNLNFESSLDCVHDIDVTPKVDCGGVDGANDAELSVSMAMKSAVHSERDRCIKMLQNLSQTLDHEYNAAGLSHWESEDR